MNKFKRLYSLAIVVCRLALRETHQIKPNYFILLEINIIIYQKYSSLNDLNRVHNFVTEKKINKKFVSSSDQFFFFSINKCCCYCSLCYICSYKQCQANNYLIAPNTKIFYPQSSDLYSY